MTIRVECTVEGLTDAWIELPEDGWTERRIRQLAAMLPDEVVDFFRRYATACNLPALQFANGEAVEIAAAWEREHPGEPVPEPPAGAITEPEQLTKFVLDNYLDSRLLWFLGSAVAVGAEASKSLSPFLVNIVLPTSAGKRKDPEN